MRADFGVALNSLLDTPNHPNKTAFIKEAECMIHEMNLEKEKYYQLLLEVQHLTELFSAEQLRYSDLVEFSTREEVTTVSTIKLQRLFPDADDEIA
ncbi:MAG: hypothetical protein L3J57_03805 [Desulfuromusa sp.]|nr:hypothetical protein [Desulfuromusa sp.]